MKRYVRSSLDGNEEYYIYSDVDYKKNQVIELKRKELLDVTVRAIYEQYLPDTLDLDNLIYMFRERCDEGRNKKYCYKVKPVGTVVKVREDCSPLTLTQELENYKKQHLELSNPEFLKIFITLHASSYPFTRTVEGRLKRRYGIIISDDEQYITNSCKVEEVYKLETDDDSNYFDYSKYLSRNR